MWPTYVDVGRDILRYHSALAQHTTVSRYKHDTLEGIMQHWGVLRWVQSYKASLPLVDLRCASQHEAAPALDLTLIVRNG